MGNLITARTGNEQHSSTWAKFRVTGLDMVLEGGANRARNQNYRNYSLEDPQDGTVFTAWMSSGNKRGTDVSEFYILVIDSSADEDKIDDGYCHVTGRFRRLACATTITKAVRLLSWWTDWAPKNGGQNEETAALLGSQIDIRGRKEPKREQNIG